MSEKYSLDRIITYLATNRAHYSQEVLQQQLLRDGCPPELVAQAIEQVYLPSPTPTNTEGVGHTEVIFCSKCGAENESNSRYCKRCGLSLITTAFLQSPPSPATGSIGKQIVVGTSVAILAPIVASLLGCMAIVIVVNLLAGHPEGALPYIGVLVAGGIGIFLWMQSKKPATGQAPLPVTDPNAPARIVQVNAKSWKCSICGWYVQANALSCQHCGAVFQTAVRKEADKGMDLPQPSTTSQQQETVAQDLKQHTILEANQERLTSSKSEDISGE